MKGKIGSIIALLAILMLSLACPPPPPWDVTDIAVAPDGTTIYIIGGNALHKSTDGGVTFTGLTMPPAFVSPPRTIAAAPDNPSVVAASDSATSEAVWVSTNGGVTWAPLPALNGVAANMRIMDLQVGPARAGTILGRDYLVATADETAGVARGSFQIIGETASWVNIVAPGTADFTSCEFSSNFNGDFDVLGVGSTTAATNLYTYDVKSYSTAAPAPVHAAVQLSAVVRDFGAATNGIIVSDIALPVDYDTLTLPHERALVSFASAAAAPNNGGIYRCDSTIAPVELGMASTRINSIAYSGTVSSGQLLAGEHATTQVWHTTTPWVSAPTWVTATTPPTGLSNTVVGMHPQVLTNHIWYAGTFGGDSGFFISTDNGDTFH